MEKVSLDALLVTRGMVESRVLAQRLVMAGQVRVNDEVELMPSTKVSVDAVLTVDQGPRFVSRGGDKLEAALAAFGLDELQYENCADVGASTGGFTDCLLQHGAGHVYAVDVGYGELDWKLRNDPRVTVMERTNARNVKGFPDAVNLVTIDASFISLKTLLPVVASWFGDREGRVVALVKPQFEAKRKDAAKGEGVIRDPAVHRQVLNEVLTYAQDLGFGVQGLIRSPLHGPKGNTEFLAYCIWRGKQNANLDEMIGCVLENGAPGEI